MFCAWMVLSRCLSTALLPSSLFHAGLFCSEVVVRFPEPFDFIALALGCSLSIGDQSFQVFDGHFVHLDFVLPRGCKRRSFLCPLLVHVGPQRLAHGSFRLCFSKRVCVIEGGVQF